MHDMHATYYDYIDACILNNPYVAYFNFTSQHVRTPERTCFQKAIRSLVNFSDFNSTYTDDV